MDYRETSLEEVLFLRAHKFVAFSIADTVVTLGSVTSEDIETLTFYFTEPLDMKCTSCLVQM